MERCLARASQSAVQRDDDNAETLRKRLQAFVECSKPVVELYRKFGKVRHIDASESVARVYEETKKAILPQVSFMLGPVKAGKTTLAHSLCERTNMTPLDFSQFLRSRNLTLRSEEDQVKELIKYLVEQASPRVLIEEFPQSESQARFFMKNCVVPQNVFYVRCSLDESQERMLLAGKSGPNYLPSTILSKKVRAFNENAAKLLPFLRSELGAAFVELDTGAQTFEKSFKELCVAVEPTVLHIRSFADEGGLGADELYKTMMWTLTNNWGYAEVNVNELISLENERRTPLGREFMEQLAQGKNVAADAVTRMLRKVVYSGDGRNKYILSGGFPYTVEHAKEFERQVSQIAAVIYSAMQYEDSAIHVNGGSLSKFSIDTLFQKEFRLRVLTDWDEQNWQEIFDSVKIDWALVTGAPFSGKTTLCQTLKKALGAGRATIVDPKELEAGIRASLAGPEGEALEGKVPQAKLEDAIGNMIARDKKAGKRVSYVFDGFPGQTTAEDFARFAQEKLKCPPDYIVQCSVQHDGGASVLQQRLKKRLELEGDLSDEQIEAFRA